MRKLALTAIAAALVAVPGAAAAQASASVQAQATVLAPISVNNEQDLVFGQVIPGISSTVLPADANAGRFLVSGAGILEVSLDFGTLPSALNHATSTSTLPLSFGVGSAGVGVASTAVDNTFDPSSSYTANLSGGGLYVFVGGTVSPSAAQEAGTYDGTITLTVAYTGN